MDGSSRNFLNIVMPRTVQELESEAMELSEDDRVRLIHSLLGSLQEADPETEQAWISESERRLDAFLAGAEEAVPAQEVFARIEREMNESGKTAAPGRAGSHRD